MADASEKAGSGDAFDLTQFYQIFLKKPARISI